MEERIEWMGRPAKMNAFHFCLFIRFDIIPYYTDLMLLINHIIVAIIDDEIENVFI